uniref:Insecticidal crystal protein CryET70 n=1 Tax=Bacillus thuringiensis TaxID=1428 RepID=Q93M47_BACTU|nr:insecticidal crystal protein CryET70 [Bacillus thuringiensis]
MKDSISKGYDEITVQASDYIDIRSIFQTNGSATFNSTTNITTLTQATNSQAGAIAGKTALDMRHDFTFRADIFLGTKSNGADGIAIAFHRGSIGFVGEKGGGLGILGALKGIGFELDTYANAPQDEQGDSFGHGAMRGLFPGFPNGYPHAGFVSTDKNRGWLSALAQMQRIAAPNGRWRRLAIHWDARNKKLTANLEDLTFNDSTVLVKPRTPRYARWELSNPAFELDQKYTFVIGSATGASNNLHQIGIIEFDAYFTKPTIEANNVSVPVGATFNPKTYPGINLRATDEIDGDLTSEIIVTDNNVNTSKSGVYNVTYYVKNSYGESDEKTIEVTVFSNPTIIASDVEIEKGESFNPLTDSRVRLSAQDSLGNDITSKVKVKSSNVDTSKPGEYDVVFEVTDNFGGKAEKEIKVTVLGQPSIEANDVELEIGDLFNPLTDSQVGLRAKDSLGKDITNDVKVKSSNVDTSKPGEYEVVFEVTDRFGKKAEKSIKVLVLGEPSIEANNVEIEKDERFDPLTDSRVGLRAKDSLGKDITNDVKVKSSNVDTSKPGEYEVVFEVTDRFGKYVKKLIVVIVPVIDDEWEDGNVNGWKFYAGQDITLLKDPEKAYKGEYVFYDSRHAAISKTIPVTDLQVGGNYEITVYVKAESGDHHLKVTYKKDPKGPEEPPVFNRLISTGKLVEKDYRELKGTFRVTELNQAPLIIVENFGAGYIGGIRIVKIS